MLRFTLKLREILFFLGVWAYVILVYIPMVLLEYLVVGWPLMLAIFILLSIAGLTEH